MWASGRLALAKPERVHRGQQLGGDARLLRPAGLTRGAQRVTVVQEQHDAGAPPRCLTGILKRLAKLALGLPCMAACMSPHSPGAA